MEYIDRIFYRKINPSDLKSFMISTDRMAVVDKHIWRRQVSQMTISLIFWTMRKYPTVH